MNKNSPLNQRYICPIGADGIQLTQVVGGMSAPSRSASRDAK